MTHSSRGKTQWLAVRTHFLIDAVLFVIGMGAGAALRFSDPTPAPLFEYIPAVLCAALVLPSLIYVGGLYSVRLHLRHRYRLFILSLCYAGAVLVILALGSLYYDTRVGRGVLLISAPLTLAMLFVHHGFIVRRSLAVRDRVAMIVTTDAEYASFERLRACNLQVIRLTGMLDARDPSGGGLSPGFSPLAHLPELVAYQRVDCLLCTKDQLRNPRLSDMFRRLSFSGVRLMTMGELMEEAHRLVPLGAVDLEWLLHASTQPHRSYVRKWKRLFDVSISVLVGLLAAPLVLLGMAWVKLVSPGGPVIYRQIRSGRLGREFQVFKLRTMRVDAEANGPQWAKSNDDRTIFGGRWMRKFRVDEIPQLYNVLRGEMSFVGPRPERPEFEDRLAAEIPFFRERLLVAPGLTGWAQVNYPYGASVEDARRKLEYDLYYMKHMTITLDLFIILDTVRIVLGGGVSSVSAAQQAGELLSLCPNPTELPATLTPR